MQVLAQASISLSLKYGGYIAGTGDGIVTINGAPSSRHIYLMDALTMQLLRRNQSLQNGRYLFLGLDTTKDYLVVARDYKRELEPFAWDYVQPANDLTIAEQQTLWQTWQT